MNEPNELEEERLKRRQLEEKLKVAEESLARCESQLDGWHRRSLEKVSGEVIVDLVQKEQISSLMYHLYKSLTRIPELEAELASTRKALEEARKLIPPKPAPKPEQKEASKQAALQEEESTKGQRIGSTEILSEDELTSLLGMDDLHNEYKMKQSKTIKDIVDLILRLQRVKLIDASILLDVDKGLMNVWVEKLRSRGLIQIEGIRDPILVSTNELARVRKMMR